VAGVDATARFARAIGRRPDDVRLDDAALAIAAHARPDLDPAPSRARLDDLADRAPTGDAGALVAFLFGEEGFAGNRHDYYDPANSYLPDVLDRRVGIPISLAVVALEVARRRDVELTGVGMPGHFLLAAPGTPDAWFDPFDGGRRLDLAGVARAYEGALGTLEGFGPGRLRPVDGHELVLRMLANLRNIFAARGDRGSLRWVVQLRTMVPCAPQEERAELAQLMVGEGAFTAAAVELERLGDDMGGALGAHYRDSATRLRARLN
jgi:regulator of sirC expression with transglutaminase-like and TPR domain